jgi:hypothetical protein
LKTISNTQCAHPVLGEICDRDGTWHTGFLPYGQLASLIGTTTADLMRRLQALNIVEHLGGRHRLTRTAIRKRFGMVYRKHIKGQPGVCLDVILPGGMVYVVTNLVATNLPETEIEKLVHDGQSQSSIAARLGCTQQAVSKHLRTLPPRLQDWPIAGSWDDTEHADNDNQVHNFSVSAA